MIMISSLNALARENGLPMIAALGAQRILAHVTQGGFLGANADHYALGIQRNGRVVKSGYACFTDAERVAAFYLAEVAAPSLWDEAEMNFRNACREAEEDCDCWTASNVPGASFATSDDAMEAAIDAAFPRGA